ncbi:hypothetical protein Xvie_03826 [Xenorhabdus vietnamensis]|uniref:Uncharacterized protein n=1 Tax=Xenorhabdus vietnamensis TaxID=351656 RepID=A0A1Y2S6T5_9GAMM|nr:hypothetical protein [Xenorhabdus vietnamensis]OTA14307.1 hypothetical protein Xvie_03826 [Xenorhabdus vietnamensis]
MSIWQVMLLLILLFFIALFFSFKKEKTGLRTTMRVLSIAIPIILVSVFFVMKDAVSQGCYSDEQNFYEKGGTLCYGTGRITQVTIDDNDFEIERFMVLSKNKVVIHTKDDGDFVGTYSDGIFIVKWLDDLTY